MDLDLTWRQEGDLMRCNLAAQLIYTADDGNPITLWEDDVDLHEFRGPNTVSVFNNFWKREIDKFFGGFEDAYREAKRNAGGR